MELAASSLLKNELIAIMITQRSFQTQAHAVKLGYMIWFHLVASWLQELINSEMIFQVKSTL